jgi:hypothetical protein
MDLVNKEDSLIGWVTHRVGNAPRRCVLIESVFTESVFAEPFFRFHRKKRKADKNLAAALPIFAQA